MYEHVLATTIKVVVGKASQQTIPAHANTHNLLILPSPAIPNVEPGGIFGESVSGSTDLLILLQFPGSIGSLFFNCPIALPYVLHQMIRVIPMIG